MDFNALARNAGAFFQARADEFNTYAVPFIHQQVTHQTDAWNDCAVPFLRDNIQHQLGVFTGNTLPALLSELAKFHALLTGPGVKQLMIEISKMAGRISSALMKASEEVVNWVRTHPTLATSLAVALSSIVVIAAPMAVAGPALAAAGFGASGVSAGSLAAAIQARIGPIAAGSVFATLQSAGAAGAGAWVVNAALRKIASVCLITGLMDAIVALLRGEGGVDGAEEHEMKEQVDGAGHEEGGDKQD